MHFSFDPSWLTVCLDFLLSLKNKSSSQEGISFCIITPSSCLFSYIGMCNKCQYRRVKDEGFVWVKQSAREPDQYHHHLIGTTGIFFWVAKGKLLRVKLVEKSESFFLWMFGVLVMAEEVDWITWWWWRWVEAEERGREALWGWWWWWW